MGKGHVGDFMSFWIDDTHSSDLGLTRVSDGSRYTKTLLPSFKDQTADVPGGDGVYYYGSRYEKKTIPLKIAFDDLTEKQMKDISQLFGDKQMHKLVLDEEPYKEYLVKLESAPELKYLCFENHNTRIYKGDGELKFVCYEGFGRNRTGYRWAEDFDIEVFANKEEWLEGSQITSNKFGWILNTSKTTKPGADLVLPIEKPINVEKGSVYTFSTVGDKIAYPFVKGSIYRVRLKSFSNNKKFEKDLVKPPEEIAVPYIGNRLGFFLKEDRGSRLYLYNENGEIKLWVENNGNSNDEIKDYGLVVYKLVCHEKGFFGFDSLTNPILGEVDTNNFEIYTHNGGDIETPFIIKFLDAKKAAPMDIYLNNKLMLSLAGFDVAEFNNGEVVETTENIGFQINTKTWLIEGLDRDGKITGTIFNQYINGGTFGKFIVGDNILKIVKKENVADFNLLNAVVDYRYYYYI